MSYLDRCVKQLSSSPSSGQGEWEIPAGFESPFWPVISIMRGEDGDKNLKVLNIIAKVKTGREKETRISIPKQVHDLIKQTEAEVADILEFLLYEVKAIGESSNGYKHACCQARNYTCNHQVEFEQRVMEMENAIRKSEVETRSRHLVRRSNSTNKFQRDLVKPDYRR